MPSARTPAAPSSLRDTLFGDCPLAAWGKDASGEPWDRFQAARQCVSRGDNAGAVQALMGILGLREVDSRHTLQAWDALRGLGVMPGAPEAKRVLGVVVEVPMDGGLDVLAAYEDNTARFIHHAGSIIVVDAPVPAVTSAIAQLLNASRRVVAVIGPHDGPRPPAPSGDMVRLSFLTPSGLHFGQGPMAVFFRDGMAGPVLGAATALMQQMLALSGNEA